MVRKLKILKVLVILADALPRLKYDTSRIEEAIYVIREEVELPPFHINHIKELQLTYPYLEVYLKSKNKRYYIKDTHKVWYYPPSKTKGKNKWQIYVYQKITQ